MERKCGIHANCQIADVTATLTTTSETIEQNHATDYITDGSTEEPRPTTTQITEESIVTTALMAETSAITTTTDQTLMTGSITDDATEEPVQNWIARSG